MKINTWICAKAEYKLGKVQKLFAKSQAGSGTLLVLKQQKSDEIGRSIQLLTRAMAEKLTLSSFSMRCWQAAPTSLTRVSAEVGPTSLANGRRESEKVQLRFHNSRKNTYRFRREFRSCQRSRWSDARLGRAEQFGHRWPQQRGSQPDRHLEYKSISQSLCLRKKPLTLL